MAHLVGLGKEMMVTSTGSFTNGGCWYNWAVSPFLWLLVVFISKEKPRRCQQSRLELCDGHEASPRGWMAERPRGFPAHLSTRVQDSQLQSRKSFNFCPANFK